jgi:hypothetical protein
MTSLQNMPNTPDHEGPASVTARLSLIIAIAACICLAGAIALRLFAELRTNADMSLKQLAIVLAYVSAVAIAVAFVSAWAAIGQFMLSRVQCSGQSHVHAALLLCFLWTAGMVLWQHLGS